MCGFNAMDHIDSIFFPGCCALLLNLSAFFKKTFIAPLRNPHPPVSVETSLLFLLEVKMQSTVSLEVCMIYDIDETFARNHTYDILTS